MPPARLLSLHTVLGDSIQRGYVIPRPHINTGQGWCPIQSPPTPSPGLVGVGVLHSHEKSDMRVSYRPTPLEGEGHELVSGERELPHLLSS